MKILALLLTLFFPFLVEGQNLIPNPSFESINYCETKIPCSPSEWYSVSNMPYGYQNNMLKPANGKHSIAFLIAFEKEIRTYWQTMLLCNLQAGKEYMISFYLYAPNSRVETSYFGVYLSDTLFRSGSDTIIQKNDQTTIPTQNVALLKNGWYKITLPYKATGNEKYLLLGNFAMDSNNTILRRAGDNKKFIEYYIDDIALVPTDKHSRKCSEYQRRYDSLYVANIRHADFHNSVPAQDDISDSQHFVYPPMPDTLLLGELNFNFDSDTLISTKPLNDYFDSINFSKISNIEIVGYTDSIGKQSYNLKLSEKRALSVKEYLLNTYNLPDSLVTTIGKGIIKDNTLLEKNRRVELRVYRKQ